jgi:hypothetical membrane protein
MKLRFFFLCGMIAPVLFVVTAILGGALRPGYSHIRDTMSELFSPGSPNKALLDAFHTIFALLLISFGIGLLLFVLRSRRKMLLGSLGAASYIAMGGVSVLTATTFHQDPWGTPATFAGRMHINLSGVVGLLSIASFLLLGFWFQRVKLFPGFWAFSLIIVGLAVLSAVIFFLTVDSPVMGLTERITALVGFTWTFVLARWLYLNDPSTQTPITAE